MAEARKISFQEAWDSSAVFFVDEELEKEIDAELQNLLEIARDQRVSETVEINSADVADFLNQRDNSLDVILGDIGLPEEKFICIISLLHKLGRISGDFDGEWSISEVKSELMRKRDFASIIAEVLVNGKRDQKLQKHIPRRYLDMLDYRETEFRSQADRCKFYKRLLIESYEDKKVRRVEGKIREQLDKIQLRHGLSYIRVHPAIIRVGITLFAVPSFEDAWVVIAGSFQEQKSIDQIDKVTYILSAYERVCCANSRYRENRAYVNFVDGGGWLARKLDLEQLVEHCHYFINLQHLDMLEAIVLKHVPESYFGQDTSK